jgi:predicted nucleic acid-binding protein
MGKEAAAILVLDASVLINFLRIDRIDLIRRHASTMFITEHVRNEVTEFYPDQLARLDAAIADASVQVIVITDIVELNEVSALRSRTKRLGVGECSAIMIAVQRGYDLAIDDKAAIKQAATLFPALRIHKTEDLMLQLILGGILDVKDADRIKTDWAINHQFRLKFDSFRDRLS